MNKDIRPISCPNCGGTVEGSRCPYCGSVFWDVADLEVGKPAWLRFRYNDRTIVCKAIPKSFDIHYNDPEYLYADNRLYMMIASKPNFDISMNFFTIPYGKDEKELYRVVEDSAPEREKFINNMEE